MTAGGDIVPKHILGKLSGSGNILNVIWRVKMTRALLDPGAVHS